MFERERKDKSAGGAGEAADVVATDVAKEAEPSAAAGVPDAGDPEAARRKRKRRRALVYFTVCGVLILGFVVLVCSRRDNSAAQAAQGDKRRDVAQQNGAGATGSEQGEQLNQAALNEMQRGLGNDPNATQAGETDSLRGGQFREDYFPSSDQNSNARQNDNTAHPSGADNTNGGGLAAQMENERRNSNSNSNVNSNSGSVPATSRGSVPNTLSVRYAPLPAKPIVRVADEAAQARSGASDRRSQQPSQGDAESEVLPPFGTKLPVRVVGNFFAPSSADAVVLLALQSDLGGDGWSLPRETLLVGRIKGVVANKRVEVAIFGYVNPETNRLVRVSGDALGSDGGTGFKGQVRNRSSILARFGRGALNVATGLASGLAGGYLYRSAVPIFYPGNYGSGSYSGGDYDSNQMFVEVGAGETGFVLIKTLPGAVPARDAAGVSPGDGVDQRDMELLRQIRAAGQSSEDRFRGAVRESDTLRGRR